MADLDWIDRLIAAARGAGRVALTEPEGYELLDALGVATPGRLVLRPGQEVTADDLAALASADRIAGSADESLVTRGARPIAAREDQVVVKVVGESLAHKTELGGVAIVRREPEAVNAAAESLLREAQRRLGDVAPRTDGERVRATGHAGERAPAISGILVTQYVIHEPGLGGEILVALRWTPDFGPVVVVGPGGVHAEALTAALRPETALAIFVPGLTPDTEVGSTLDQSLAVQLATRSIRGRAPAGSLAEVADVVARLGALASRCGPQGILELEVNPLAIGPAGIVAVDALVTLSASARGDTAPVPERPRAKIGRLLKPRSIAIVGVSSGDNPGRTILRNVLRDGFPVEAVTVIKPGQTTLDGCRCVPDVDSLPGKVDLLVVALAAARAAALVTEVIERDAAESVILIPSGLEETTTGTALAGRMHEALAAARSRPGGGPLINGGNCLGVRSRPGRYDTLFIPESRLAAPSGRPLPLAIVAQSGAFAITRLSRIAAGAPKYVISVGNQMDLTIGDHLEWLAADPEVAVVGVYVEGFRTLDGQRFLRAARAIRARGGRVVLYRAGRTAAGSQASRSHTAAMASDADLTVALARQAGVVVAESLESCDDLIHGFTLLSGREAAGARIGAVTNAGMECVAIADNLGSLEAAHFDDATRAELERLLGEAGVSEVVEVHNPVDLSPMSDDRTFSAVAATVLASPVVDAAVIGAVPFTPELAAVAEPGRDLFAPESIAGRLVRLWAAGTKPWVAVVDGGPRYDHLAQGLEAAGIPTFRTADTAMHVLEAFIRSGPAS
jgi:acyl-CoA synthetase (NDP forming)